MIDPNGAYLFSKSGTWPNETYNFTLLEFNTFKTNNIPAIRQYKNTFRYIQNPIAGIDKLLFDYNTPYINYTNCAPNHTDTLFYLLSSGTVNSSSISWTPSNLRVYDTGYIYNYFSIQNINTQDIAKTSYSSVTNPNLKNYAYLLYPSRFILVPTSISNVGGQYILNTEVKLLSSSISYFAESESEYKAYLNVSEVEDNLPYMSYETLPSTGNVSYTLCAVKMVKNKSILSFSEFQNPYIYQTILSEFLGRSNIKIRPSSTYVTYKTKINTQFLKDEYEDMIVGQSLPEYLPDLHRDLMSSFIINQDIRTNAGRNLQTFQLVQSTIDLTTKELESFKNCIQSLHLNLTSGTTTYSAYNINTYPVLTGEDSIGLSYIAESSNFFVNLNDVGVSNNTKSAITAPTKTWTLSYPPHNYSFKAQYVNALSASYETTNLNFYLSSGIIEKYPSVTQSTSTSITSYSAFKIKNILVSDYGFLTLPLDTYATQDLISFECIDAEPLFIESLSCFYGSTFNTYYDLKTSPFVNAASAKEIIIKYPKEKFGHIEINLNATLSTFCTTIDNKKDLHLIFSENKSSQGQGYPIEIEKLKESENQIILSCARLSSVNFPPHKDLSDSNIRWSYTPNIGNIILASVDYNTFDVNLSTVGTDRIPYIIPPNTSIPFNDLTGTILISGYGANEITIKLETFKYDEYDTIITNPVYYDFLNDNKFTLLLSDINNAGKSSTFSISAKVKFGNQLFEIPQSLPLYWKWTYNSDDNPLTQPITAYKIDGTIYKYGDTLFPYEINTLKFLINLDDGDNFLNTNELIIDVFCNYRNRIIYGTIPIYLNDYPNKNLFNVDFKTVYYTQSSIQVADTYNDINVITRPKEDVNTFTFKPDLTVLNQIQAQSITWIISSNTGTLSSVDYYTNNNISYEINNNATVTTVTLSAYKATLAGWDILNNISSTTTIYTPSSSEFINNLNFLIYPPYTWEKNGNGYITPLNNSNYTLAVAPSSYRNKKSKSQNFVVSANKTFESYDYFYSQFLSYNTTLYSISGEIEIPYHDELFIDTGSPILLIAHNEKYPRINGTTYTGVSGSNVLYDGRFPITANTIPFSSVYINTVSSFRQSPTLLEYEDLNLNFILNSSAIDLDNNIVIKVAQNISNLPITINEITAFDIFNTFSIDQLHLSATNPIVQTEDILKSVVTYKLSCKYWETDITTGSATGIYDLFVLRVGDPSIPLHIRDSEITTLTLNATANILAKIPDTTFKYVSGSYDLNDYDLWDTKSQILANDTPLTLVAYSTSVKPKIYISSYYTLTGESIRFEFETPENTFNFKITSYDVFFGDSLSAIIYDDVPLDKIYDLPGIYNISYNVYYNDGSYKYFELDIPISVYANWNTYDQNKIRLLNEINLNFGNPLEDTYDLEQIQIQPNEWGDVDIFNTAISRLNSNLNYLIYNSQTINTNSPTLFYGWLGNNSEKKSYGVSWHTQSYNKEYVNSITNAVSLEDDFINMNKFSYFNNIVDAIFTKNKFYVIDGTSFRAFSSGKIPQEIFFENINEINSMLVTPNSIYTDETGDNVYISDAFKNKIYKLNIDPEVYPPEINLQLTVGNLGDISDTNKFNSPSEIVYSNEILFVLDYNNKCVKQFTKDLNWMFTYYTDEFETDQPINIAIQPETLLVYVLTKSYKIYIFDYFKNVVFESFDVSFINDGNSIMRMFFSMTGDFFYILNEKNIYKYSASGSFISQVTIPNDQNIKYNSGKSSDYSSIILCTNNSILKCQDILTIFKIGQGLPYHYWTEDQLLLSNDDFPDDVTYNRSLNRITQNIKSFRDTLESRFVIVTEQTDSGVVEYFSLFPVSYENRPIFDSNVENETLGVGVNEFHIPQVFNRELNKIYNALLTLKDFLNIKDVRILNNKIDDINTGCLDGFCWSWKSMSCYNLSLPIIRICNINPITYAELKSNFPSEYSYVPNNKNKYGDAISKCCSDVESPLNITF